MTLKRILKSSSSLWSRQHQDAPPPSSGGLTLPTVRLNHTGPPIWLYATSDMERKRARTCTKEPWTTAWIETEIRQGDVLYDIGANVGVFSLLAAKTYENDITVMAFEPGYASFARLCENIVLNRCETAIIPIPLALSSANGLIGFTYRSREPGESRHRLRSWRAGRRPKPSDRYEQPALAIRLDELVERHGLPAPHHIKLDVDGWELHVLEGAQAVLRRPALRSLMIEVQDSLARPITELLADAGFTPDTPYQRKLRAPLYIRFHRR